MLVIEKPHSNSIDMKGGCVCPKCLLSPDQVKLDELYPLDYGPDLILCPRCGLVPARVERKTLEEARDILANREARGAFFSSTRRRGRGSGDPVGEAKEQTGRRGVFRVEQDGLGFPDHNPCSRSRSVEPLTAMVNPSITQEIDLWLKGTAAIGACTDSDVARACLSWAYVFRPKIPDRVLSLSEKRKRFPVRLTAPSKAALVELADAAEMKQGRFLLCLLDEMRRKSSWSRQLTFDRE